LDQRVLFVAKLLAEIPDIDLDVVGVAEEVITPDLVEDAVAGQHLVGVHQQQSQKVELPSGKLNRAAVAPNLAGGFVHRHVLYLQLRPGARIPAAHDRSDSSQQLAEV